MKEDDDDDFCSKALVTIEGDAMFSERSATNDDGDEDDDDNFPLISFVKYFFSRCIRNE